MKLNELLRIPAYVPADAEVTVVGREHFCGVPGCEDGKIVSQDERDTVVECDTHDARTTHDTSFRVPKEQQIIRVQDGWRQHGTQHKPK